MAEIKLLVSGMTCNHCVMAVKQALERVAGVTHANVNLNEGIAEGSYFYFVHSYRPVPEDPRIVVGRVDYGGEFAAAVALDNVFAVQFHPEKSQAAGKRLLDAFATWVAS